MGQYFYRPVSGGLAQMGRDIGRGVEGGVEGFLDERRIGQDRQIEAEARRRAREKDDLNMDILLNAMGGGRGEIPASNTIDLPDPGTGLNDQTGISIPRAAPTERRNLIQMGDFYIEDQESAARRGEEAGYELGLGREAAARTLRGSEMGPAAMALTSGNATEGDFSTVEGWDEDPTRYMDEARPKPPVRGTPEYIQMLREESQVPTRPLGPGRGGSDDDTGIGSVRHGRVFNIVKSMAEELNDEGYVTGSTMSMEEMLDVTRRILAGDEGVWDEVGPRAREVIEGSMAGYEIPGREGSPDVSPASVMAQVDENAPASALTGGRRGPRGGRGPAPDTVPAAPAAPAGPDRPILVPSEARDSLIAELTKLKESGLSDEEAMAQIVAGMQQGGS